MELSGIVVLAVLAGAAAGLQLEETMPSLSQELKGRITNKFTVNQKEAFRYDLTPSSKTLNQLYSVCHIHPALITLAHSQPHVLVE